MASLRQNPNPLLSEEDGTFMASLHLRTWVQILSSLKKMVPSWLFSVRTLILCSSKKMVELNHSRSLMRCDLALSARDLSSLSRLCFDLDTALNDLALSRFSHLSVTWPIFPKLQNLKQESKGQSSGRWNARQSVREVKLSLGFFFIFLGSVFGLNKILDLYFFWICILPLYSSLVFFS